MMLAHKKTAKFLQIDRHRSNVDSIVIDIPYEEGWFQKESELGGIYA